MRSFILFLIAFSFSLSHAGRIDGFHRKVASQENQRLELYESKKKLEEEIMKTFKEHGLNIGTSSIALGAGGYLGSRIFLKKRKKTSFGGRLGRGVFKTSFVALYVAGILMSIASLLEMDGIELAGFQDEKSTVRSMVREEIASLNLEETRKALGFLEKWNRRQIETSFPQ